MGRGLRSWDSRRCLAWQKYRRISVDERNLTHRRPRDVHRLSVKVESHRPAKISKNEVTGEYREYHVVNKQHLIVVS